MFAFVFDSVGGGEWIVLAAVVLIVAGPQNLPKTARKIGNIIGTIKRTCNALMQEILAMDEEEVPPPPPVASAREQEDTTLHDRT